MSQQSESEIFKQLSRITVIIPTYQRPESVARQFEYWSGRGPKVFILDGSQEPLAWAELQNTKSNVHYIHSGTTFNERRTTAGKLISSEFAILLPDDEFHLETGLFDCVGYLDSHPDVIGCAGKVLGFFLEQGEFRSFLNYEDWLRFPLDCDTVQKRLEFALPPNKAHKVECSLFRADAWSKIFTESYQDKYSSGFTYERLLNLYAAVLGRTELIESVLWMRSLENPPLNSADAPRHEKHNFVAWATDGEFDHEVTHYLAKVRKILRSAQELTDGEVDEFSSRFLFGGVQRQIDKERQSQRGLTRMLGRVAIKFAPKWTKIFAKRLLPSRLLKFTGWRGDRLEVLIGRLSARGITFRRAELERIAQLALKYADPVSVKDIGVGTQAAKGSRL